MTIGHALLLRPTFQPILVPHTDVYSYSGAEVLWVVPAYCTSITVYAWGAGGGASANARSGGGGFVTGSIPVTPGETLKIRVGRGGIFNRYTGHDAPGLFGGGAGGNCPTASPWAGYYSGGQGGDYAGVFRGSTPLLIAPGGGGGGSRYPGQAGAGGGTTGGSSSATGGVSTGGTQSSGGVGGNGGNSGTSLLGGNGNSVGPFKYAGGGGGGGYYGGGGGGEDSSGGGGSAFVPAGGSTLPGSGTTPGSISNSHYVAGVGVGRDLNSNQDGGNGRIVIEYFA